MPRPDALIIALDLPDPLSGSEVVMPIGHAASVYKIGLGVLTTGGLALAMALRGQGTWASRDETRHDISATIGRRAAVGVRSRFSDRPMRPGFGHDGGVGAGKAAAYAR